MKNNYSIAQRNAIVEANLWCIDSVIRQNRPLMRAARLEYDDVYQQLALRLIKAWGFSYKTAAFVWRAMTRKRDAWSSTFSPSSSMSFLAANRPTGSAV